MVPPYCAPGNIVIEILNKNVFQQGLFEKFENQRN